MLKTLISCTPSSPSFFTPAPSHLCGLQIHHLSQPPPRMFHLFPVSCRYCVFPSQEMWDLYKPCPLSHLSASAPKPLVFPPRVTGVYVSSLSQRSLDRPPPSVLLAVKFSAPWYTFHLTHYLAELSFLIASIHQYFLH